MSSFIIDKKEYYKALGVVAGVIKFTNLASQKNYSEFWLYNYKENRNIIESDLNNIANFLYQQNVTSTCYRYNDKEINTEDNNDYTMDLLKIKKQVYDKLVNGSIENDFIPIYNELFHFFNSALYQMDEQKSHDKASLVINKIMAALYKVYESRVNENSQNWGEFNL